MRSSHRKLAALMLAALTALPPAVVQAQDDLTLPPRADEPAPSRSSDRPGAARLADPPQRDDAVLEEVVVVGEERWRLPDLGSEWREREEQRGAGRIRAEFFRVYDPGDPTNPVDPFPVNSELSRVGFIEVFRFRFGRP